MKRATIILLAMAITLTIAVTTWAKVTATCTVKAIQEQNVILDCGKKTMKLKIDDRVKVSKRRKGVEPATDGC